MQVLSLSLFTTIKFSAFLLFSFCLLNSLSFIAILAWVITFGLKRSLCNLNWWSTNATTPGSWAWVTVSAEFYIFSLWVYIRFLTKKTTMPVGGLVSSPARIPASLISTTALTRMNQLLKMNKWTNEYWLCQCGQSCQYNYSLVQIVKSV